jgi:hypothetical protein
MWNEKAELKCNTLTCIRLLCCQSGSIKAQLFQTKAGQAPLKRNSFQEKFSSYSNSVFTCQGEAVP